MPSHTVELTAPAPSLSEALEYFLRLLKIVRPYWGRVSKGVMLGVLIGAIGLIPPALSKLYIDTVHPTRDVHLMHTLVFAVAFVALTSSAMSALRGYYTQVVASQMSSAVGLMYFNHLQHLPMRFFDEHRVGEVASRSGDMRNALATISRVVQTLIVNGAYVVLVPPLLLFFSWQLTILALLATPITLLISTATSRILRVHMKRSAESSADLGAIQIEAFSQIRTLKSMGVEFAVFRECRKQGDDVIQNQMKVAGIGSIVAATNGCVRALSAAIFTWYAWTLVIEDQISLGSLFAFTAYLGLLTGPVSALAGLFMDFQQSAVVFGRAFEYLDLAPEQDPASAFVLPCSTKKRIAGAIAFESVSFGYSSDQLVLQDFSLTIDQGSMTAIVGESGVGKSSILRLLCRLVEPASGVIRVDGVPITDYSLSDLRRQIAIVWQEPTLLRGTIWQNLTIGLEGVTNAEVDAAILAARLDDVIAKLPLRYDTPISEWGASVSGGQRQRFAIARAVLRQAPVLLLDEATSQLDVRTELEFFRGLLPLVQGKTVVYVTHRLATAAFADRIVVMDRGRVNGVGSHEELSRDNALYGAMLSASSFGEENRPVGHLGLT